jgi:monoamine oxidase
MASSQRLRGRSAIVAGAGLAGLAAARALERDGASVAVIEARSRVGGRVWTSRDAFADGQHAEAGADLIEDDQSAVLNLAHELGLPTVRILRRGFGFREVSTTGATRIRSQSATWRKIAPFLAPLVDEYRLAERRWDGAIAARLARRSVADWLDEIDADAWTAQRFRALRGLFLADPEHLSLLALVDFFSSDEAGPGRMFRLKDGNDRLATAMVETLRSPPELGAIVRRVRQDAGGVAVTIEAAGRRAERRADVFVSTLPTTTLRDVVFELALPETQREAIERLRYGPATRLLLQFARRFWNRPGRPTAFGSDQPIGAVWDGNEQQKGAAGILSFLAGGGASAAIQRMLAAEGDMGVAARLDWLGRPTPLVASQTIVWERDPWAGGGYACFDPEFNPHWRDALAQPAGRVVFAGEHTSIRWQGYMNGAIESGLRAAAEVRAILEKPRKLQVE